MSDSRTPTSRPFGLRDLMGVLLYLALTVAHLYLGAIAGLAQMAVESGAEPGRLDTAMTTYRIGLAAMNLAALAVMLGPWRQPTARWAAPAWGFLAAFAWTAGYWGWIEYLGSS